MPIIRPLQGALLLVLFSAAVHGQTASPLVSHIDDTGFSEGAAPTRFYTTGGNVFFFGASGAWVSDGTSAGTVLLASFCPEAGCSPPDHFLGDIGGTVLWVADGEGGRQLWRSDGTRAGTYPLTGPGTGITATRIDLDTEDRWSHVFFQEAFYFVGCRGFSFDCRTWRTDGSAEGTVEAGPRGFEPISVGGRLFFLTSDSANRYELRVTADPSAGSTLLALFDSDRRPRRLTAAGNKLFFIARTEGDELWVSDGTEAGTRALTDFAGSDPFAYYGRALEPAGNRVYFAADDVVHGREIWVSDGTPQGTRRTTEFGFDEPVATHDAHTMEEINGKLVFFASDGIHPSWLWTTTGAPESTAPLPSCPSCALAERPVFVRAGGRLLFVASDDEHGSELWSTDGTPAGTRMVADVCPGECSSLDSPRQLLPWPGGALLMGAHDGVHGSQIWLSDGTGKGTRRVTDADLRALDPFEIITPVSSGGKIWFSNEQEGLWITDGAPESTRMVTHLGRREPGSHPRRLTSAGGRLDFNVGASPGRGIWSTLGTPESTIQVSEHLIDWMAAAGGLSYFWDGIRLGRTDGTRAGTFDVAYASSPNYHASQGVEFQGRFFLLRWNELWVSDGTAQGTGMVFSHPNNDWPPADLAAAGGALYFRARDEQNKYELWTSDGTASGTRKLHNLESDSALELTASGPLVYFRASGRLWKTDGTPEGTVRVLDDALSPEGLTAFQGGLAFFGLSNTGRSLWWTDGTAAGTVALHGFESRLSGLTTFAGKLFFAADDGEHGTELWTSDGTAAGTVLLRDLFPGWLSSSPRELTVAGGRLFFAAADPAHGSELWATDGTTAGTRLVQDLNPYAHSSKPEELTVAGDRLYFVADDGLTGRELWTLPLAATGCQPSSTRLCLNGGRFQAEAVWKDFEGNRGAGQAVALTPDTGYFWFFSPSNVEAVLKVLDGRGLNNHFWTFYGALSSVEYHLTVTDTQTGAAKRYYNPPGQLASVGDTNGFGPLGAFSSRKLEPLTLIDSRTAAVTGPCLPTAERLCLNGGRFAVEADWKDFQGKTGTGKAVNLTADTGWFWFFDAANLEVMIKVLDGTTLNGKHWVFYGALSNVEYTLTVTDTVTGKQNLYKNPGGRFGSVADTGAF